MPTVNQSTPSPTRKVTGGAVVGIPSGVILVWLIDSFAGLPQPIPGEVAAAIGSLLSVVASYFVKERG